MYKMKFKDAVAESVKKLSSSDFIDRVKEEDETMLQHLDILKKINKRGFITTESQAGRKRTGEGYTIHERAYVSGFMLESNAATFIKDMAVHTDKNAIFVPHCEDSVYIPGKLDIPLTITERKNGKVEVNTHSSSTLPQYVWESFRKEARINKDQKIVLIFCWDSKWDRNASKPSGLFSDVLKMLEKNY